MNRLAIEKTPFDRQVKPIFSYSANARKPLYVRGYETASSLFDGIRHEILTAARERRLENKFNCVPAVNAIYGELFEEYVFSLLFERLGSRLLRIPESPNKKESRADFLVLGDGCLIVVEVKGGHSVATDHAGFMSVTQRLGELRKIGVEKAGSQIASTIKALRTNEFVVDELRGIDWTITPIVPLVITDERIPLVYRSWELLYKQLFPEIDGLMAGGYVAPARILNIADIEMLADVQSNEQFARLLMNWSGDPSSIDWSFRYYLFREGIDVPILARKERFQELVQFVTARLELK